MAKLKNGQISGLVGSIVIANFNDAQIVRTAPRKRNTWSDKQKQTWKRFSVLTGFWKQFDHSPVQRIWKIADKGGRGINLFIKTNMPAFGSNGELTDPGRLHFSAGTLPLPHRLTAERNAVNQDIEILWDPDHQQGTGKDDDELLMLVSKDENYSELINTGVHRKTGAAVISLPGGMEEAQRIFLSFGSEKRKMYSPDQHFVL